MYGEGLVVLSTLYTSRRLPSISASRRLDRTTWKMSPSRMRPLAVSTISQYLSSLCMGAKSERSVTGMCSLGSPFLMVSMMESTIPQASS